MGFWGSGACYGRPAVTGFGTQDCSYSFAGTYHRGETLFLPPPLSGTMHVFL